MDNTVTEMINAFEEFASSLNKKIIAIFLGSIVINNSVWFV